MAISMGFLLGSIRQWHWISASICMAGMLLFSVTGITLNHGADISVQPDFINIEAQAPEKLVATWLQTEAQPASLSSDLSNWLQHNHNINIPKDTQGEWDTDEFYLAMPRPGGDAWLALDIKTAEFVYEDTERGWIAFFNDLHKGRDSGTVWRWFMDIFAAGCVIFSITGLVLLWRQTSSRQTTAPLTALGLLIPLVIILIFMH